MLKKQQEEQQKKRRDTEAPTQTPKDEESVKEILDNLKREKDRSLGNIKELDEDIRKHEERLRKLEDEMKNGE